MVMITSPATAFSTITHLSKRNERCRAAEKQPLEVLNSQHAVFASDLFHSISHFSLERTNLSRWGMVWRKFFEFVSSYMKF
jgi:hypothetical protein